MIWHVVSTGHVELAQAAGMRLRARLGEREGLGHELEALAGLVPEQPAQVSGELVNVIERDVSPD